MFTLMRVNLFVTLGLVSLMLLFGCRGSGRRLEPNGGVVISTAGARVTVPTGALTHPTDIAITEVAPGGAGTSPADMPLLPPTVARAGSTFALTPHGTTFQVPVTIEIPVDATLAARAGDSARLRLYTAEPGGAWTVVSDARVVGSHVEADVRHFSFFIVGFEVAGQVFPPAAARALDILFVVDNSPSMAPSQAALVRNFPSFMATLKNLPDGLPSVHVGVVSSDMGAGREDSVPQCRRGGDRGVLQAAPRRPGCVGPRGAFISASEGETTKNYDGSIEDAFACIAAMGDVGCGFEHQLGSAAVALGYGGQVPPENAGFLRPEAYLAVVFITNEDDCSAPPDSMIFDHTSRLLADPLGPLASYRCNEFGHLCAGKKPPRSAPAELSECRSAEDGLLLRVSELASFFKSLKPDPGLIFMSAITGPVAPYQVRLIPSQGAGGIMEDQPAISHSCMSADGRYADPPIRLAEFIAKFGDNGTMDSICAESFAPSLTRIGAALTRTMGPRCLQAALIDSTGAAPTLAAGCEVVERVPGAGNVTTETPLAQCNAPSAPNGATACWHVAANAQCPASGELRINRTDPAPTGAVLAVRCTP